MTADQRNFFLILQDYLHGRTSTFSEEPNWNTICAWANSHKLGGIFYAQCTGALHDSPALRQLSAAFGGAISHAVNLQADYAAARAALKENGIPHVPVKGVVIAPFYPDPELRTMGDIDILVHQENREEIKQALTACGFINTKWSENEWDYKKGATLFELHAELMKMHQQRETEFSKYLNSFWEHVVTDEKGNMSLDPDFHFLYLVAHIAIHFRWVGVGFRQFFDLAIMMERSGIQYDWSAIHAAAEQMGFDRFLECALAMVERWFGTPSPYGTACLEESLFTTVTEKIFADGVFGFGNKSNEVHDLEKNARGSKLPLPLLKLKTASKLAFPPYRDLVTSSKYAYLRGRPYLLPVAWVRRAIHSKGSANSRRIGTSMRARKRDIDARQNLLKELGL